MDDKQDDQLMNMHEVQKLLGKSRSTIYAYMRQGMPCKRKGRNIFFKRNDVLEWRWQHQVSDEYREMINKAENYFPFDPVQQIKYLRNNASWRTAMIGMVEIINTAFEYTNDENGSKLRDKFVIDGDVLKNFCEGLLTALEKVDTDDYDYLKMVNKMSVFIESIIRQRYVNKYGKKKFKTFWDTTVKTMEEYNKEEQERYNYTDGGFLKSRKERKTGGNRL